jgi:ABC-2 type transport system ATP-binding protein
MLELHEVSKRFGDLTAVDSVSFTVRPGVMTGFIGANGAGKTTTMRIVLGVLAADRGTVRWKGSELDADARRRCGYMPEERGLYPKMGVLAQLVFLARLHGLSTDVARVRATDLLTELGLGDRTATPVEKLSLGNQQRAQIAAALVHDPELLVLDEPFSGLDPVAVDVMAGMLRRRAAEGAAVLFSSHQLDLVERLCDDVVIIDAGRVVAAGPSAALREERAGARYRLTLGADPGWLRDEPGVTVLEVDGGRVLVELAEPADDQRLLHRALDHGPVRGFARAVPTLAEIFREAVR